MDADHFVVDYADLSQVRALAGKIRSQHPRIDVLLNNAGRMASKIELTPTATNAPIRSTTWRRSC